MAVVSTSSDGSSPGSPSSLRAANRARIVAAVRAAGSLTQAQLARDTGLSPATVSNLVRELESDRVVAVVAVLHAGRRARAVTLNPDAGIGLGLDFGHRHLRVAVGDVSHAVLAVESMALPAEHTVDDGLVLVEKTIQRLLPSLGRARSEIVGVGLGLPAPLDAATGRVVASSILPGWAGVAAAEVFEAHLGAPVHVDNDANLGALAEMRWGAARSTSDAVYLKVATGIGAGLVMNGRIYRGSNGTAGEIGHITVDEHGVICHCGNRGCLETVAGAPALLALLRASIGDLEVGAMVDRALAGDPGCRRVLGDAGSAIGSALADLANLLNPKLVVVGGDLARSGEILLAPMRAALARRAIPSAAAGCEVVASQLGDRAEVLGALALVLAESAHPALTAD